jgi:CRP-like cAMP-binding protein
METRNRLLASLTEAARAALYPHLREVALSVGRIIAEPGEAIERVYFPSSAVVSIVTLLANGRGVESLTVGREGAVGLLGAFGEPVWTSRGLVQIAGGSLTVELPTLREIAQDHPSILDAAVRYAQVTEAQLHQAAACNALHALEARLCRWLLTSEDRVGDNVLPLTQEFLGLMLGTQRTRVTTAAQALQREGLIDYRRGRITILDRGGLERASCECYRKTEDLYAHFFPQIQMLERA